ncbi:MAG TPA: ABC transporter permease [Acidobacteriota bacterium]|nr:ABC transporter permease [Acidobacteriota bacterium]
MIRIQYLLRRLKNAPLFSAVSLLTLALGIGAVTAVFSMIEGIVLKPLPYPESGKLVSLLHVAPKLAPSGEGVIGVSQACFFTYREEGQAFEDVALYSPTSLIVEGRERPERVRGLRVTDAVLPLLRTRPLAGRLFRPEDDRPESPRVAVISHGLWQRRFGAQESALGSQMRIDGIPWTVIGVLPPGFDLLGLQPEVLVPYRFDRNSARMSNFSHRGLARLKPQADLETAAADVERMIPLATEKFPRGLNLNMLRDAGFAPYIRPLKDELIGDAGQALWLLLGAVGIVLIIACTNVANLFLVRSEGRKREFGVRRALGASRLQIGKEIAAENLLLAAAGGGLGLLLAQGAIELLKGFEPSHLPRLADISISVSVVLFALSVSLLSMALCSLLPLLGTLKLDLVKALKSGSRGSSQGRHHHRVRNLLVVGQLALALTLLIGSGLLARSFYNLSRVEPGFQRPQEVATMKLYLPEAVVPEAEQVAWTHRQILESIRSLPGVTAAGVVSNLPMAQEGSYDDLLEVEEFPVPSGEMPPGRRFKWISPGYLEAMEIPLISGRVFDWNDVHNANSVVLVNRAFTRLYWPDPSMAVGKRIRESGDRNSREIVGVIGDVRDDSLAAQPEPTVYWPLMVAGMWGQERFVLRTHDYAVRARAGAGASLNQQMREAVWSANGSLAVANMRTLDTLVARSRAHLTFTLALIAVAAGGALLLAMVGIYGVISHSVSQRTQEIGIRAALGADRRDIGLLILRHGLMLTGAGVILGVGCSVLLTRWMTHLLYQTGGLDPLTYSLVIALLSAVALAASGLPARRAARLDPVEAMRQE